MEFLSFAAALETNAATGTARLALALPIANLTTGALTALAPATVRAAVLVEAVGSAADTHSIGALRRTRTLAALPPATIRAALFARTCRHAPALVARTESPGATGYALVLETRLPGAPFAALLEDAIIDRLGLPHRALGPVAKQSSIHSGSG